MELKQLEYFTIVCEKGSFSQAAECLYTSQPNVSKVISSLEKELGRKLVERSSRGLRITPYGETVLDYAKVILKHASLISSMATHHNGKKFTLATYPSNMITNLLVDFYRHWGREYIVEHQEGSVEEVSNWVASGQTEIGIVYIAQRQLAAFRHILGHKNLEFEPLDVKEAFFVRYFDWVLGCLHGDFGISYVNPKRTVAGELLRCLPATLQLAGTSFVIVAVLSIPIGFLCAVYKDGWFDKIMRGLVFVTTAMPAYWVGLLLMWGIGVKLNWLPTNGNGTWRHLILPSFTVALSYISTYIRLIRNNMLENMKQDYVLYANVRGLPQKSILVKHILKNSMHTCIVAMGMSIPQLISGTIVVENVFSWPGLGTLCISSIFNRDYPVIQTYVLLIGVLFVLFNLLFDILQTVSDPRLRKED